MVQDLQVLSVLVAGARIQIAIQGFLFVLTPVKAIACCERKFRYVDRHWRRFWLPMDSRLQEDVSTEVMTSYTRAGVGIY